MNGIINQVKRVFTDDGRNDKDFTAQEIELKVARDKLYHAIQELKEAADNLCTVLARID